MTKIRTIKTNKSQLRRAAWERGLLSWKLLKHQRKLYNTIWDVINDTNKIKHLINCTRRFGKTHVLCLVATEFALRRPDMQIRFAAPTHDAFTDIIGPIMKIILRDCPDDLKPEFKGGVYRFKNGSEIHTSGTNNGHHESLRGMKSDLNIVDEAGFMQELRYIIRSILIPQTLTCGGKTIISSTPSKVKDHDYFYMYQEAKEEGNLSEFTIYDNTTISKEVFNNYLKEAGGEESDDWKREYLVQFITDSEHSIIPEWKPEYVQIIERDEYFQYYKKYVGLDTGVRDYTAALFGYYDYKRATLIVEDEYTINGPEMTTDILAEGIREKEAALWPNDTVHLRIADNNNLVLVQDLTIMQKLTFLPTSKTALTAMINQVRMLVKEGRLIIHPRCEMLIGCLSNAIWGKPGPTGTMAFGRSKVYGHYDHLAALVYLIRNVDYTTNPVSMMHKVNPYNQYVPQNYLRPEGPAADFARSLFGQNR